MSREKEKIPAYDGLFLSLMQCLVMHLVDMVTRMKA